MPTTLTATNPIAYPLLAASYLVAGSTTFQAITSSVNAEEARLHCYFDEAMDTDRDAPRPRAIIVWNSWNSHRVGTKAMARRASIEISVEIVPDRALYGNLQEEQMYAARTLGDIVEEMELLAGTGTGVPYDGAAVTHINIVDWDLVAGPGIVRQFEQADPFYAIVVRAGVFG